MLTTRLKSVFPLLAAVCFCLSLRTANAEEQHIFIDKDYRVGAYPSYDGNGWVASGFLNIPDEDAVNLFAAEVYVDGRTPDFVFRTPWIDFPAGPVSVAPDSDFTTMGDFLNGHVTNVSPRIALAAPFGNFLLRFTGFIKIAFEDQTLGGIGFPVGVDFGISTYDGMRIRTGETIFSVPISNPCDGFFRESGLFEGVGLFPIEITYYNRVTDQPFDCVFTGLAEDRAGIELYSWHGGGLELPVGAERMIHPVRGPATVLPPRIIYQFIDIRPLPLGDFTADSKVNIRDFRWFETCFDGGFRGLGFGCDAFDFDGDFHVDWFDFEFFQQLLSGP